MGEMEAGGWLTNVLLQFTSIGAEWVLWLLVILSLINVLIMIERAVFYLKRTVDVHALRVRLDKALKGGDWDAAAGLLREDDSMEARVVLYGVRDWERGPAAVADLMDGAMASERNRYDRRLWFLGTIGNNAPFIGLFGTVLGIINAFGQLAEGSDEAARMVMGAISEALVATGVGILVAIPAVIAFNVFKARIKTSAAQTELLGKTLLAHLRARDNDRGSV